MGCDWTFENITNNTSGKLTSGNTSGKLTSGNTSGKLTSGNTSGKSSRCENEVTFGKTLLYRNIDRGSKQHLYNVMHAVALLCGWLDTDKVQASCCCNMYTLENGILTHNYDPDWKYEEDGCVITDCRVCESTG